MAEIWVVNHRVRTHLIPVVLHVTGLQYGYNCYNPVTLHCGASPEKLAAVLFRWYFHGISRGFMDLEHVF